MAKKPLSASVTRPADTTAYADGDVIGTATNHVLTFENAIDETGGDGADILAVVKAWVIDSAKQSTLPSLELWLFTAAPAAQADNAAFGVTDAELMAGFVGIFPLSTSYVGKASDNCIFESDEQAIQCQLSGNDLYGVLVVRNAYTPISAEQFKVLLTVL